MSFLPHITESSIRQNSTSKSFSRGQSYYFDGNVSVVTLRGNILSGEVFGSEVEPYRVTLEFDKAGITSAYCTCPYDYGGWCKHIVATNLTVLHHPEKIEERPTLTQLLDRLSPVQTQGLIQHLIEEEPALIEEIDRYVSLHAAPEPEKQKMRSPHRPPIDPAPFRREVRQILLNGLRVLEDGYEDDPLTEELLDIIDNAQGFIEVGQTETALVILEAIAGACAADWDLVADYGADNYYIVETLDSTIAEAILSSPLTTYEQNEWRSRFEPIQDEWDVEFSLSFAALAQGWDYPPLVKILAGDISEGVWGEPRPDYADDLALVRLRILDREEKYDEYLYLAQAEGLTKQYLTMLASLGRVAEATAAAQQEMTSMDQAFVLAKTLRDRGALSEALEVVQKGLDLPGNCEYEFGIWASDLAEGLGESDIALKARKIAFQVAPSFADYTKLEEYAAENWDEVKEELLAVLRASHSWKSSEAKVDIFLHEGLLDEAIATVDDMNFYQTNLVHQVMKVAIDERPNWVIENATLRAESIIDRAKASAYEDAIEWLKKARLAYIAMGRNSEWKAYRANLLEVHARKYKLRGLLNQGSLA